MRIALAALFLVGATAAASAQQGDQTPPPGAMRGGGGMAGALMHVDADGDGIVTRAEAIASADAMFDRIDANRDGTATPDEIQASRPPRRNAVPPAGDMAPPPAPPAGTAPTAAAGLSRQQWRDRALRQFDRIDANHDGRIDRTEITAYQDAMRERRIERRGGGTPPAPAPAGQPQ